MADNQIKAAEAVDKPSGEAHGNVTASQVGTKYALDVNQVGGGTVGPDGEPIIWDTITYDYSGTDSDVFTYSLNATDVLVITTTYTDATKGTESTTVKTIP